MEHKIKTQIVFFYSERSGEYTTALKELEATAEKFAGQIIMLHLDVDDPNNKPVRDTCDRRTEIYVWKSPRSISLCHCLECCI